MFLRVETYRRAQQHRPMQVPSGLRATETMSDEHTSQVAAPLAYEQVPVQYGSHAEHRYTYTQHLYLSVIALKTNNKFKKIYRVGQKRTIFKKTYMTPVCEEVGNIYKCSALY